MSIGAVKAFVASLHEMNLSEIYYWMWLVIFSIHSFLYRKPVKIIGKVEGSMSKVEGEKKSGA